MYDVKENKKLRSVICSFSASTQLLGDYAGMERNALGCSSE